MKYCAGVGLCLILFAGWAAAAQVTEIKELKVVAGADSAHITWQATEGDGISGWSVEWISFSDLAGRVLREQKLLGLGARECVLSRLGPGRLYHVRVAPCVKTKDQVSPAPASGQTGPVNVRVGRACDTTPAAPEGLSAVADAARVRLMWRPSPEWNIEGYEISRKAPDEADLQPYARLLTNSLQPVVSCHGSDGQRLKATGVAELLDTAVEPGKEYVYSVRAFAAGEPPVFSEPTKPLSVRTEPYVLKPEDVVLVVNTQLANGGKIAAGYCAARGVPTVNVVKVNVPVGAEIKRSDYNERVLRPVQRYLAEHPRTVIIALVRGIPWRIPESGQSGNPARYAGWDRASVDSELALARAGEYPLEWHLPNPFFGKVVHLSPVDRVLAVCRLDGPDDKTASELVRRAMAAERLGVEGIAFFDTRGLTSGGYVMGDRDMLAAAELLKRDGRLPVEIDEKEQVIDLSQMPKRIGFYWGWYAGGFQVEDKAFSFGRGAVAAHLHSFAGYDISATKGWVGPLVLRGAAAAIGTADEPLLDGFPVPCPLLENLLAGRTLAEAALAANRYLSWMSYCIGDPSTGRSSLGPLLRPRSETQHAPSPCRGCYPAPKANCKTVPTYQPLTDCAGCKSCSHVQLFT